MLTGPGDLVARIGAFLEGIGIPVATTELGDGTFLPGVTVRDGRLLVDAARLAHPGDLLHEAGHLAVVPAAARPLLGSDVAVEGLDLVVLEAAVLPWSYAAALEAGIDPAVVFHDDGYHGHAQALLRTYALGVVPGLNLLVDAGMAADAATAQRLGVAPYPAMLRWLRP